MNSPVKIDRFPANPLFRPEDIQPSQPNLKIMCSFNPGAILFQGKRLLLLRVAEMAIPDEGCVATPIFDPETGEVHIQQFKKDDPDLEVPDPRFFKHKGKIYLTSLSHLRIATSEDGLDFTIDEGPSIFPVGPYETFGIEDARITEIEGTYYINYTAASDFGVVTSLITTTDFRKFERKGIIFGPDNKDVAIFPEKIDGRYQAFHRPAVVHTGKPSIWTASSTDMLDWGRHEYVIGPRSGHWDCERVGAGSAPIKTPEGWLAFYHAADYSTRYCLGLLLLDLKKPSKVLARSEEPFFVPETPYECEGGFMPNVVFHNGTIAPGDGTVELYYGGGDLVTCGARVQLSDLLSHLK
ncbi:glycoside hydrolase family 130 protein [Puniceicoccus vermicola]|uniref:Glycosidase n=1 Tax=Puniceicoccus vermicola TaxID=388746 RepID=A0A7X1E641_9BACT|nr:glycoside hydrolase family 130 protein [Puniceicoccus vermicola]MBC2603786.1 glycosidase [Puniceicoccus vermicola]